MKRFITPRLIAILITNALVNVGMAQDALIQTDDATYRILNDSCVALSSWKQTFEGNGNSHHITLPDAITYNGKEYTITEMGNGFSGIFYSYPAHEIETITLPKKLSSIGYKTFMDCTGLTTISLPYSLRTIDKLAFVGSGLKEIQLPVGLRNLCLNAFNGTEIRELNIPRTVDQLYIDDSLPWYLKFLDMDMLETIMIDPANEYYDVRNKDNAIYNSKNNELIYGGNATYIHPSCTRILRGAFANSKIMSIEIPDQVTDIMDYAFVQSQLEEVIFHNGLKGIYPCAFALCRLTSVTIPESVLFIENSAFDNNPLKTVYCEGANPAATYAYTEFPNYTYYAESNTKFPFDKNTTENAILYAPKGYGFKYLIDRYWCRFKHIEEYDFTAGFDDTVTDLEENGKAPIYDLSGRKVSDSPQKGIYIKNGKKYFVR